ncbi:hypothetical protein ENSA5_69030 [Enhygromyxa salina]|uniref:Metal-dependent HD superfamily phosphohydrolase n=1 Tax=Enhygromyxa salina TaxID=215803 RepID=A0A2S9XAS8_9BACT|nr:hypothetical protein [Enhygromyxa salina]PRP89962.1 hypothetical protein ENSA5_69030 [Enhygromyxa salina]
MTKNLASSWAPLLTGYPNEAELLSELGVRYSEAQRAYHGLTHIDALTRHFLDVARGPGWRQEPEVKLAILFHDAIYVPGRPDNEARSAELARASLQDLGWPVDLARVEALILATKAHELVDASDDPDLAHFIDADMAIVGAAPKVYDAYAQAVRDEFVNVPGLLYRRGRERFLRKQLARDSLFHSELFARRYEHQARANLARELAALAVR